MLCGHGACVTGRGASARGACALGPPRELEGGLEACPGEGGMRNRQGLAGEEEEEGLDHWGGADVGGMAAAEAEGTSGADVSWEGRGPFRLLPG